MLALLVLASFEAVAPLPLAYQQLGRIRTAARRLFELADAPPPVREPEHPAPLPAGHDLAIRGLSFAYPGARTPALVDIDLTIRQGERVAIVGPSGSGKSTLLDCILRFREPDSGVISLGGQDIAGLRGEDLRRRVTLVSQRTHLFAASIGDNLRLADPDASAARLEQACRAAQIHDWIATLPEGYDTWVGETGVRLSGGQARRIAIARALLRDAPVLLLDEPTEGLDAVTERELFGALDRLMTGRTAILISHRALGPSWLGRTLSLVDGRLR
jgi:ATP-binding cassette subfamily C protein CydC